MKLVVQVLGVILLFCNSGFGAMVDPFFQKIGIEQGLSHRRVNCILQDHRNFIWFGTEDGLNRYDGRYFIHFKYIPNNQKTISGNIITDLYEDKGGILWIATRDGGLSRYDYRLPSGQQFVQYRHNVKNASGIPENGVTKIAEDNQGFLWLGTSGNFVVRFDKKTGRFDTPVRKGTKSILSLYMGAGDTLWVGRAGGGLLKINTKTLAYRSDPRYEDLYATMPHVSIPAIYRDSRNQYWLSSWDKLVYKTGGRLSREIAINPLKDLPGSAPDDVVDFAEDKSGAIWMATKNSGVAVYSPENDKIAYHQHDPQDKGSIADDHVNDILIDRSGIIWLATSNGVSMSNPIYSPFRQHVLPPQASDIKIFDFFKDPDGRLWIGTSEGLFIKNDSAENYEHRPLAYQGKKLSITKFYAGRDKKFYLGTDYTLFEYDRETNQIMPLPNTEDDPVMRKLINSRVVSIVADTLRGHPVLLVSPYGHFIAYYDLREKRWVSRTDTVENILKKFNVKDNLIRKFYRDKQDQIWLATYKAGLGQWKNNGAPISYFANVTGDGHSLSSNDVFDIQEDTRGNFWVSTYGGGVNFFDKSKRQFTHMAASSNLTEGMQLDGKNNLWMLCNGHVHRYEVPRKVYTCYDLPRLKDTGGLFGYFYKDDQGIFYAAGLNYYVTFNPSDVAKIDHAPAVYFTDFIISGQSFSHYLWKPKIELSYKQNIFSIVYSAPEYTGDNLQYAYMMEGVDSDWVVAGKNNTAQYTNLRGGTYKFRVKATNWKGSFTDDYNEILIVVKPPFWATFWFWSMIGMLALAATYLVYRYRLNQLLKQQAIRNGIAQDLHDQVGATLSSISVYSEVARRHAAQQDINSLNNVLQTINSTANEMVLEMADIVWAINPNHDHFESVLHRIKKYAHPLCEASGICFRFHYDETVGSLNIGMKSRKNIYLIIKESINNAVKHSGCKIITVVLSVENQLAEVMVSDDGAGFLVSEATSGDGNGLKNITSRAAELNAKVEIASRIGAGTTLTFCFQVQESM